MGALYISFLSSRILYLTKTSKIFTKYAWKGAIDVAFIRRLDINKKKKALYKYIKKNTQTWKVKCMDCFYL